jgi:hypothetical protein
MSIRVTESVHSENFRNLPASRLHEVGMALSRTYTALLLFSEAFFGRRVCCTKLLVRFNLDGSSRKIASVRSIPVPFVLLADCFEQEKIVVVQEVVFLCAACRYDWVFFVISTCIAERAVPKGMEVGAAVEFHAHAVVAAFRLCMF